MPVLWLATAQRVAAGSASPAETHLRRLLDRYVLLPPLCAAIARYEVGAVKHTVARYCAMAGSSASGVAFSIKMHAAGADGQRKQQQAHPARK